MRAIAAAILLLTSSLPAGADPPQSVPSPYEISGRIAIQASDAAPDGMFPWVVSLFKARTPPFIGHFCGGVLIKPLWVLTAAHCVYGRKESEFLVYTGTSLSAGADSPPLKADKIFLHADFEQTVDKTLLSDYALIKLVDYAGKQDKATIAVLPPKYDLPQYLIAGEDQQPNFVVAGWGSPYYGKPVISPVLRYTQVKVLPADLCKAKFGAKPDLIRENLMICAVSTTDEGGDACRGDSGGPLMLYHPDLGFVPYVIGVVSWGVKCGPEYPGVYARLSAVTAWINTVTSGQP